MLDILYAEAARRATHGGDALKRVAALLHDFAEAGVSRVLLPVLPEHTLHPLIANLAERIDLTSTTELEGEQSWDNSKAK